MAGSADFISPGTGVTVCGMELRPDTPMPSFEEELLHAQRGAIRNAALLAAALLIVFSLLDRVLAPQGDSWVLEKLVPEGHRREFLVVAPNFFEQLAFLRGEVRARFNDIDRQIIHVGFEKRKRPSHNGSREDTDAFRRDPIVRERYGWPSGHATVDDLVPQKRDVFKQ